MISRRVQYYLILCSFFLIGLTFAFLAQTGFYGYGKDFFYHYSKPNSYHGGPSDRLGWLIATLTIYEVNIGVFLTSLILSFGLGKLLLSYYRPDAILTFFLIIAIYVTMLHTWPVILGTSNAMRQALAMSLLFYAVVHFENGSKGKALLYCVLMAFSHKSSILFLPLIFIGYVTTILKPTKPINIRLVFLLVSGVSIAICVKFLKPSYRTEPIGLDLNPILLFIGFLYFLLVLFKGGKTVFTQGFLLTFIFFSSTLWLLGYNFQVERLWMMILIIMMVDVSFFFKGEQRLLSLLAISLLLLAGTFYAGIYEQMAYFGQLYQVIR